MTAAEAREEKGDKEEGEYPVENFDFHLPGTVMSHAQIFDELHGRHGPFVRSTAGARGYWIFMQDDIVRDAFHHPEIFSSVVNPDLFLAARGTSVPEEPPLRRVPIMVDPPEQTAWRQLTAPYFAPKAVEAMVPKMRSRCADIVTTLADRGSCEFIQDFARRYPTTIFELMGLPLEDLEQFLAWEDEILHLSAEEDPDRSRTAQGMAEIDEYFTCLIEQKRAHPEGDLLTAALSWEINGEPITHRDMLSFCVNMLFAGLDTVAAQLAYSFWYLAEHPEQRHRIINDPSLVPAAVEELLRCFSFTALPRRVVQDVEFHGCPLKKGDALVLPTNSANRDPAVWSNPTEVAFDRSPNNHIAFGVGTHRCLGSHLARRELRVALEEWQLRIPNYRLADPHVPELGGRLMWRIDRLELIWSA
jgi:cytochrome P450